ncbi:MAG: type II toxin-antitoxin system RelE/ParE family toxin [Reichenbachiella sp.]
MSKHTVYLSPIAELKLEALVEYLNTEWGLKSKTKFLKEMKKSISKIENFPESCPKSELYNGIYKCVVSKLTSFYYRIENQEVEILTITDNRQNPIELLEEVRKFR